MDVGKKFDLIKRNTEEIVGEEELKKLLKEKKNPSVYLGTAITGRPHIGYFIWVLKLGDFLKAGFKVKILLADLHGALDGTSWEVLDKRYEYYKAVIPLMFKAIGVDTKNLEFVKGSEFQLKPEYMYDVLQMSTNNSVNDTKRAAAEVVKMGENPKLAGLIYPIMQALDEQYLDVDVQYGGLDQRKILMFARENLPKIGYDARVELMTPMIPGLIGKKMSASDSKSKIDFLDSEEEVVKKVKGADCVAGDSDNGVMAFTKCVIMTLKNDTKKKFVIKRDKKFGGDLKYGDYESLERDFKSKKLHPLDLKIAVADEVNSLLAVFRKSAKKLKNLSNEAYN
ncbi:tyrosine--tRNA ligase [Candidatus Pacearchaeota archaeon]|nr:tyrosine--tRNA ligase [Candidatus Pacearchaeota archaeon]|tara:strand:+ start:25221 stop:26237 length:1017 start_codon:yes stop_codon:yes gene_type:complete